MPAKLVRVSSKTIHVLTQGDVYTVIAFCIQVSPQVAADGGDPIDTMVLNAENPQMAITLYYASNFRGIMACDPYRWSHRDLSTYFTLEERRALFKTHVFARENFDSLKSESRIQYDHVEKVADEILVKCNMGDWMGSEKFMGNLSARTEEAHV